MDDVISRQDAIDKLNERQRKLIYCFGLENDAVKIMDIAKSIVITMPSAQPERKTGKWIYNSPVTMKCNQCGLVIKDWDWHRFKCCPNCGANMKGEQDDKCRQV